MKLGDKIYLGSPAVDSGATIIAINGSVVTLSQDVTSTSTAVTVKHALNMTLITPDGTEITVQGATNRKSSGENLTTTMARVEVYSSLDNKFYDYQDASSTSSRHLTPDTQGINGGYKAVSLLNFIGGRNIDSLVTDPLSGNPTFTTTTKLSTRVTNQAGGSSDLVIDLDLSDTTLQAGAFQITHSRQNGEPLARLTNVTVDNQGRIVGVYGTGKQQFVGQVALVHFENSEGLIPIGKNAFAASVDSGTEHSADGVVVGRAGTGIFGDVKGQALESSNVDLANELVRLMVLQRSYSANSQSMKAFDQTLRDTLQMVS
jgi:flagellar hook-basal body protein